MRLNLLQMMQNSIWDESQIEHLNQEEKFG